MFLRGAIRSGRKGRRAARFAVAVVAMVSIPLMLWGFHTDPPLGLTGAPGEGTCASCHGSTVMGSGVTVTFPSMTYTPGGGAQSWTVNVPSGTPSGFELSTRVVTDNSQAGTLTAGTLSAVATSNNLQYVFQSGGAIADSVSSWTIQWTPPAANVGNVNVYVVGVGASFGTTFENSYTLTPAVTTPPPTPTLMATPSTFTFTVNGANPPAQTTSITISPTTPATTVTTGVSPANSWLKVLPPSGSVGPLTVTVSVDATGLAAGPYTGSVSITPPSSSGITALSLPVTLNVTTPIPPALPTLEVNGSATPTGLNFTATVGGTAPSPQNATVTASDASQVAFSTAASTTSGGRWLGVGATSGTTGMASGTDSVTVTLPSGITPRTYQGSVVFTSSAVSNSSGVTLPVTLTVNSSTPPPTTGETYSLVVVNRQSSSSGGGDFLLLDGSGSVNSSNTPSGSGFLTRFRSMGTTSGERRGPTTTTTTIVSSGTWTPTSVTSYTPITGSTTGGTLVLQVQLPHSFCPSTPTTTPCTGTLTITSNSTSSGVTLAINGGPTFAPIPAGDIGTQSIRQGSSGGGGDDTSTGTGTDH